MDDKTKKTPESGTPVDGSIPEDQQIFESSIKRGKNDQPFLNPDPNAPFPPQSLSPDTDDTDDEPDIDGFDEIA